VAVICVDWSIYQQTPEHTQQHITTSLAKGSARTSRPFRSPVVRCARFFDFLLCKKKKQ
jgi:phage terminase small subunit